jgi:hypothetical protein
MGVPLRVRWWAGRAWWWLRERILRLGRVLSGRRRPRPRPGGRPGGDPDAGVREPRRPSPVAGAGAVALPPPGD